MIPPDTLRQWAAAVGGKLERRWDRSSKGDDGIRMPVGDYPRMGWWYPLHDPALTPLIAGRLVERVRERGKLYALCERICLAQQPINSATEAWEVVAGATAEQRAEAAFSVLKEMNDGA